jgi:release factor glutamine methyltransferase
VFAEEEATVLLSTARNPTELATMIGRRCAGYPLEHVVGWADFRGRRIAVAPGVFVPRRRTEFLVEQAIGHLRSIEGPVVVDLCCGSGNVGVVLHDEIECIELHAADVDPVAVACARENLASTTAGVHTGDLYDALPRSLRGRVDLIVADAPYVPTAEIEFLPTEARVHESRGALDGGRDGLDHHRRIAAGASDWLTPIGTVLVEISANQAEQSKAIFADAGLTPTTAYCARLDATVVAAHLVP